MLSWHLTYLIHWGRVTHTCVGTLTIIGSDNGLSPGRRQAIFWTNAGILLIGPWGTNFSEILIGIQTNIQENAFENGVCERASILSRPQCVNINILIVDKWHHKVTWNCVNIGSGNLPEARDSTVSAVQWISQHSPIIMQTVIFIQILTINMP